MTMVTTRSLHIIACGFVLCFASTPALAQDNKNIEPDNTKVNTRDRNKNERTADQAKNNLSDRELMQKIRQTVIADKSLSTYAHNIKIIAEHGKVTLKGPVQSDAERNNIKSKAAEIAGEDNVYDEMSIKG
jgi:hyperosmotically inducible periplasmic protein